MKLTPKDIFTLVCVAIFTFLGFGINHYGWFNIGNNYKTPYYFSVIMLIIWILNKFFPSKEGK
ncbi:hypothetical protein ACFOG5_14960 [Pedobacter fastidiosus]|uniref:hypothetical protein n=1 Tax=Pedobacter fastidiosus TaxID=2765361 RepID=UPI003622066A